MKFDVKVEEGKKAVEIPTDDALTLKRMVENGKFSLDSTGRVLANFEAEGDDWVRTDAKINTAISTWAKAEGGTITMPVVGGDGKFYNHTWTPEVKKRVKENGDVSYNISNILAIRPRRKSSFADLIRTGAKR